MRIMIENVCNEGYGLGYKAVRETVVEMVVKYVVNISYFQYIININITIMNKYINIYIYILF